MTPEELFAAHSDDPQDGGAGFHSWQKDIFDRILSAIKGDDEAVALMRHTMDFAEMKSKCAGWG